MSMKRRLALGALLGVTGLTLGVAGVVHSQKETKATLEQNVAKAAKLREETVTQVLKALGPAVLAEIRLGRQVVLPGLGVFRVVRIPEHKDLRDGRPVTVAATNYVEFGPFGPGVAAANAEGVVPAAVVPQFQYNPRPNETAPTRTDKIRAPRIRTR
jgi:nucleoid DNA-binding protein